MRISAKAEYACVAMLELAARHGDPQPLRIKSIKEAHGLPQPFLVQLLLELKKAGLVTSVRGAAGGYRLTRSPEDITLADIISAIDDRALVLSSHLGDRKGGPAIDAILGVWRDLHAEQQRMLEGLTLGELLRRAQEHGSFAYQI
jgi:Rrf2 family protein